MPEQPHKYLANTRDRNCKLCLRDKDHSIHKEAQEMPLPGTIKEDMLEIQNRLDQCDRLQAVNAELLAALEGSWQYLVAWRFEYRGKPNDEHNNAQRDRIDAQIREVEAAIAKAKET